VGTGEGKLTGDIEAGKRVTKASNVTRSTTFTIANPPMIIFCRGVIDEV
jgi:hypothetical protein